MEAAEVNKLESHEKGCLPYFADNQYYPKFNNLIKEISGKLSGDGTSLETTAELNEVEAASEEAKVFYFKQRLLYNELIECLQEQTADGKEIIPSHIADVIHLANSESIAYLKSDESKEKQYLFGLKEKDFALANSQMKSSFQQYIIPIIEQRLKDKCLALQRFWNPDSQHDSDSLTIAKVNQLPQLLSNMQKKIIQSKKTIISLECQNNLKMLQYEKVLSQNITKTETLLKEYKSKDNITANETTVNWLIAKRNALIKKQQVLMLQRMVDTYSEENVHALIKVRSELINRIKSTEKQIKDAKSTLIIYESFGDEFQQLARQYSKLNAEIDNKKWAIAELTSATKK